MVIGREALSVQVRSRSRQQAGAEREKDAGARRIGEVAIMLEVNRLTRAGRVFHHTLLDENACSHIALGEAYRVCSRALLPRTLNTSVIHIDLPLDATVELI